LVPADFYRAARESRKMIRDGVPPYHFANSIEKGPFVMAVQAIPPGYHSVTPYLYIKGASDALSFYKKAFGAVELFRIQPPGEKVGHAEIKIGDSIVMLADEYPEMGARSPKTLGGSAVSLLVYLENVDARYEQAVAAGAKAVRPVQNQFYGDRSGLVEDPFGHVWTLATHIEDIPPGEMQKRAEEWMKEKSKTGT
jgi:PhnB protein